MINSELIAAGEFCQSHNVEMSFLQALHESGLVDIVTAEEAIFISSDQLPHLEKLVSFHYDMDINLEGIEAIHHLLEQVKAIQDEMRLLKNRLGLYEKVDW